MTGSSTTQSVLEEMVKKMIIEMVQNDDVTSCSDSNNSVLSDTVSNDEEWCSQQVEQNKVLRKLRQVLKPRRRTRSSSSQSKSKPKSKRDTEERRLSILSLIDEVSKEFNLSDEFKVSLEDLNFDAPPPEESSGGEGATKEKKEQEQEQYQDVPTQANTMSSSVLRQSSFYYVSRGRSV